VKRDLGPKGPAIASETPGKSEKEISRVSGERMPKSAVAADAAYFLLNPFQGLALSRGAPGYTLPATTRRKTKNKKANDIGRLAHAFSIKPYDGK
jgi:hypothetical protein